MDAFAPAHVHLSALAQGDYSPAELLNMYLARMDKYNPNLNAIIWQDLEKAHHQAQAPFDPSKPLSSLPMTVKEAFDLKGAPTTWGIPEFAKNIATSDSLTVERLKNAGANIFGKTNVPLQLADIQSFNDIYGRSNNPWNLERTCGGSSGGSAASLASGLVALEMGSDIGGSIRTPAHFCGVFGHKPTWGVIPSLGHALPGELVEPDIAVVGPLARSATDLIMMFNLLAHPTDLQAAIRYDWQGLEGRSLGDLRVACWANDQVAPVARDVEAAVMKVAQALKNAGATINEEARPSVASEDFNRLYQDMLWGFLAVGMSDDEHQKLKNAASNLPENSQDEATRTFRAMTMDHRNWVQLHNQREHLRWAWHAFFKDFDLVISPVTATAAFPHDPTPINERKLDVDESSQAFLQQFFWAGLPNIPQLPSTVIPTGVNSEGLPIGVQIIGPAYGDKLTLEVAELLERDGFAFQAPPNY